MAAPSSVTGVRLVRSTDAYGAVATYRLGPAR